MTLSIDKSKFGVEEILVVGHLCGSYGRKPNPEKVDVIGRMKAFSKVTEVRRFSRSMCLLSNLDSPFCSCSRAFNTSYCVKETSFFGNMSKTWL